MIYFVASGMLNLNSLSCNQLCRRLMRTKSSDPSQGNHPQSLSFLDPSTDCHRKGMSISVYTSSHDTLMLSPAIQSPNVNFLNCPGVTVESRLLHKNSCFEWHVICRVPTHASWKILEGPGIFSLKFQGPGKYWKSLWFCKAWKLHVVILEHTEIIICLCVCL